MKSDLLPLPFTDKVAKLMQIGHLYIGGRDRHYRPYMVIRPAVLIAQNPDLNDALACCFLTI